MKEIILSRDISQVHCVSYSILGNKSIVYPIATFFLHRSLIEFQSRYATFVVYDQQMHIFMGIKLR